MGVQHDFLVVVVQILFDEEVQDGCLLGELLLRIWLPDLRLDRDLAILVGDDLVRIHVIRLPVAVNHGVDRRQEGSTLDGEDEVHEVASELPVREAVRKRPPVEAGGHLAHRPHILEGVVEVGALVPLGPGQRDHLVVEILCRLPVLAPVDAELLNVGLDVQTNIRGHTLGRELDSHGLAAEKATVDSSLDAWQPFRAPTEFGQGVLGCGPWVLDRLGRGSH